MATYELYAFFQDSVTGLGKTGLTVTVDVVDATTNELLAADVSAVELQIGLYKCFHTSAVAHSVLGVFKTTSTAVAQKQIPSLSNYQTAVYLDAAVSGCASAASYTPGRAIKLDNLDATVGSRSSHSAADVWTVAQRELTGFGTLVAQILAGLVGAAVTLISPLLHAEKVEVVCGDDYSALDGRAFRWVLDGWPDISGAAIELLIGGVVVATGTAISGTEATVEMTSVQTAALKRGMHAFSARATLLVSGRKLTFAVGVANVI